MNYFTPNTNEVRGRALRFLLTRELQQAGRPLTVQELASQIERYGFDIYGRASKTISDSLRWEIAKGRVKRLRRGVYAFGYAPKTTLRRVRRLAEVSVEWIVAITRAERPPHELVVNKPWYDYRWLWRI